MNINTEEIVKAAIKTQIVATFTEAPDLIEKMVESALRKPVNEHGQPPTYSNQGMPFLDFLVGQTIRNAARQVVEEYVEENKDVIAKSVTAAIDSADFGSSIGESVSEILSDKWRWNVDVKMRKDDE